jgi:hypothetical protein
MQEQLGYADVLLLHKADRVAAAGGDPPPQSSSAPRIQAVGALVEWLPAYTELV